jgi:negative regulator of replication initiation
MSMWALMMAATAAGGALLVWNMVSQTKHVSEGMLDMYRDLLAQSRAQRARKVEQQHRATADSADGEPPEIKGA